MGADVVTLIHTQMFHCLLEGEKFTFSFVSISTNKTVLQNMRHVQKSSIWWCYARAAYQYMTCGFFRAQLEGTESAGSSFSSC